ncbi:hypothetical protein [Mycolicibacterium cosmeticum]|uniref:hypothetical protein n=1 Tax=Mycolicibacterium cosmeticum TaxID=258533 RepID=UPI003204D433
MLSGFAPWIVYWVLVGNVASWIAASVALAVALAAAVIGHRGDRAARPLEAAAVATFAVLTLLSVTVHPGLPERWLLALSCAGLLVTALAGLLIGRPYIGELAVAGLAPEVVKNDLFVPVSRTVSWVWVGAFAVMTAAPALPVLPAIGWVVPGVALATGILASRVLVEHLVAEATSPHTVRKTTFVAFKELEIDQLYYLAREKADREAGADMEAYDVKLGAQGVPLTGDDSRESWPASYKLRPRKH